ncbi:MAG: hypothetical protein CL799_10545, partial [Chromatiales bacterium]|nr:hypothetical protein [Chromatiales bacterium]
MPGIGVSGTDIYGALNPPPPPGINEMLSDIQVVVHDLRSHITSELHEVDLQFQGVRDAMQSDSRRAGDRMTRQGHLLCQVREGLEGVGDRLGHMEVCMTSTARRHTDSLFYLGTVTSRMMDGMTALSGRIGCVEAFMRSLEERSPGPGSRPSQSGTPVIFGPATPPIAPRVVPTVSTATVAGDGPIQPTTSPESLLTSLQQMLITAPVTYQTGAAAVVPVATTNDSGSVKEIEAQAAVITDTSEVTPPGNVVGPKPADGTSSGVSAPGAAAVVSGPVVATTTGPFRVVPVVIHPRSLAVRQASFDAVDPDSLCTACLNEWNFCPCVPEEEYINCDYDCRLAIDFKRCVTTGLPCVGDPVTCVPVEPPRAGEPGTTNLDSISEGSEPPEPPPTDPIASDTSDGKKSPLTHKPQRKLSQESSESSDDSGDGPATRQAPSPDGNGWRDYGDDWDDDWGCSDNYGGSWSANRNGWVDRSQSSASTTTGIGQKPSKWKLQDSLTQLRGGTLNRERTAGAAFHHRDSSGL